MPQSSREPILWWLRNTASPENYTATASEHRKRKRHPLRERLPTTMNASFTPSKKRKSQKIAEDENGTENTPRPVRAAPVSKGLSQPPNSSTHSSSISSSSRSRSPKKQIAEMLFAPQPILYRQFLPRASDELPTELDALLKIIARRFSRGIGVVSDTYRAEIENETHNAFGEIDDLAFIQPKNLPGPSPTPSQCAKVVWLAQRCEVRRCFEAQWNSSVHNYVLDLAIHNAGFREKVYFLNCTAARISPPSLIPAGHAGMAMNSKMVDFVIHVEPSDRFRSAVHERAQFNTVPMSVNHTLHEPLRWCPIGVSIETKLTGQNWDDAMAQVGIWTAAQFNKLEELVSEAKRLSNRLGTSNDEPISLPFLPIVVVQGHDWHFLAAVRDSGQQTRLYQKISFGNTTSPLGVYQIITTIQLLACWVRDHFTQWFEQFCLNFPRDTTQNTAPWSPPV